MSLVVDASIAIAWCVEAEQTPAIMALLDRVGEEGAEAPALWPLEAANTLVMLSRRKRLSAEQRDDQIAFLRDLPVALDDATATQAWGATAILAERHRLSVHDAAYLELALRRDLPLATLDEGLRKAAVQAGVSVVPLESARR
ncbi:MAG: type II toxin-antitoxin system VapC family toxin [Roseomonas sp.]|nr:type II toxin-antitoxin system VapC family toxin [Roseomonas sp.]